jgi:hypothetical protein
VEEAADEMLQVPGHGHRPLLRQEVWSLGDHWSPRKESLGKTPWGKVSYLGCLQRFHGCWGGDCVVWK